MNSSSTEFTASEGRRFALPVGFVLILLAAVSRWRGHDIPVWVLGSLGVLLFVAGLVIPARLGPVYRAWMGMALAISKVTTPILMAAVYFLILTPTGLVMRLMGRKPLHHPVVEGSTWHKVPETHRSDMRRQF